MLDDFETYMQAKRAEHRPSLFWRELVLTLAVILAMCVLMVAFAVAAPSLHHMLTQ